MDFKKVLIAGVVIAGAWYLYNKPKKGTTTSTDGTASGINGAQYLYEHGAFRNAEGTTTCNACGKIWQAENQAACDRWIAAQKQLGSCGGKIMASRPSFR